MTDEFWRCRYCGKLTRATLNHHCPEKEGKIVKNPNTTKADKIIDSLIPHEGDKPWLTSGVTSEQPKPVQNDTSKIVLDRVVADLKARGAEGEKKYGSPLMTNNGRSALMDAYQESLDLCQYLCQKIMEEENS